MQNLAALGVSPDQIDSVALTHMHADHAGGMLDGSGAAIFPKADVFLAVEEDRHWYGGEPPTDRGSPSRSTATRASCAPPMRGVGI
ncbi:MBL fold metallo-hydrolase [Mesorhizobium sediminum]|nr:MBL fold metallo-hydrolase [Mesorhizobium sediminum]